MNKEHMEVGKLSEKKARRLMEIYTGHSNPPMTKVWTHQELEDLAKYIDHDRDFVEETIRYYLTDCTYQESLITHKQDGMLMFMERSLALYCDKDYVLTLVGQDWKLSGYAPQIVQYRLERGV